MVLMKANNPDSVKIKDWLHKLMKKMKFKRRVRTLFILMVRPLAWLRMKLLGIRFCKPNYLYLEKFNEHSVMIDAGCGHEAEFSLHLINKYRLHAYGVDPTIKHSTSLRKLEVTTGGHFHYLPLAVTRTNGLHTFHESNDFESGSILPEHVNVKNNETTSYTVESVSLAELVRRIGTTPVDYIKLDLEGVEYDLLKGVKDEEINAFRQIFVEFHYHCTNYTTGDTMAIVRHLRKKGFKSFTLDRHNYLFYKYDLLSGGMRK